MIVFGLFLLFTGTSVQIIINIDNEQRTWSDANSKCNLLGSNKSGLFSELPNEYQNHIPPGGNMYWIAAIKNRTTFKFNKCVDIKPNQAPATEFQDTTQPVYDCYEFCNGSNFALSSDQCACTGTVSGGGPTCDIQLFQDTQIDFYGNKGGYLEYSTIGVTRLKVNGSGEGDCAAVIFDNGTPSQIHEFLPCNTPLPSLCQSGLTLSLQTENKIWTNAVLSCNGNLRGSFDGVYNLNPSSSNRGTVKAWTGISRRSIKQWANGIIGNIIDPYECLAVSKNSTDDIVQIHVRSCNDSLPSLCEQSESTLVFSTQLTTSEGETTSFEVTNITDVTTIVTTSVTPQNTIISYPHSTSVLPDEQETIISDSLVPAIAGGAAAGVIIILLIVFIVLFRRFQQKNNNKVNRHNSGAVYSGINKSRQKSSTGPEGAALQVDTDDTYDHTVNRKSRQSVHSVQENMYDHTTAPQKEPAEDNFYDSTCRNPQKDTIINDNEYGSVNPATGNDVYSHTNQVFSSSDTDVENYDSMNNLK